MRFDVVVVDARTPSNASAHAIGGLLGAHDVAPLELLATGRRQLAELSGQVTVLDAVAGLRSRDGVLQAARLADGFEVQCDILFVAAPPQPRDAAFAHLPLERTGPGLVVADEFGRTSVAGVYAAGDLVSTAPAVVQALASGQRAAVGVTRDLVIAA